MSRDLDAPATSPARARAPWWTEPTRRQWSALLAVWSGWVLDAFDFTIFLLVMPAIAREFGVTYVATATSITLTLLFRLAGGLAAGWAADRFGRKLPLMISIAWFAACDGAVAFAPSFAWVLVLRTLFGFGMGAEWTSGTTLVMESWPARSRGIASGALQGSWAVGYVLAAIASAVVIPAHGWRALFVLAALPALLVIPIRLWVPESAEWKARAADQRTGPRGGAGRGLGIRIAWASLFLGASFAIFYGLTSLWPTLLQVVVGLAPDGVAWLVVLFNLGMLVGAIACGAAAGRFGVLPALVVPICAVLAALPLYLGAVPALLPAGAFATGAFGAGISGVTPLLLARIFPPEVRARSSGVVYHVGAMLAAPTPAVIAALAEGGRMSLSRAIALAVTFAAVLTLAVLILGARRALPPEALASARGPGVEA